MKPIARRSIPAICLITILGCSAAPGLPDGPEGSSTPQSLWRELEAGNRRFRDGASLHPHQDERRRAELANAQHPKAVVLTCSDSRVSPELLFDQGLGDLFDVRVIGNVVCKETVASIEYATEHLGVKLVIVLGHERCGAVQAALKGGRHEGSLDDLLRAVTVPATDVRELTPEVLDRGVRTNVRAVVQKLRGTGPVLKELVTKGEVLVVGCRYDLDSGLVETISD